MDDATLDQERRLLEVEISPLKPYDLTGAKSQTACDQDHGPIRFPNVQQELVKLLGRQNRRSGIAGACYPLRASSEVCYPELSVRLSCFCEASKPASRNVVMASGL
jgi:hypothetical protein